MSGKNHVRGRRGGDAENWESLAMIRVQNRAPTDGDRFDCPRFFKNVREIVGIHASPNMEEGEMMPKTGHP